LTLPDGKPDFSVATPQDLREYLLLLTNSANAIDKYRSWLRILIGAEDAIVAGKGNLNDIFASERKAGYGNVTHDPM
jgi:hypothetical protein